MVPLTEVTIYTDGSARGNPDGPGGYGAVLLYTDKTGKVHTKELSGGFSRTTNNRMELMGAIAGLEALTRPCRVRLCSDSQYLVRAFNDHWVDSWQKHGWMRGSGSRKEPVKNPELWKRLLAAMAPHEVTFVWVKGHAGNFYNERCDTLATTAADQPGLPPDPGMR